MTKTPSEVKEILNPHRDGSTGQVVQHWQDDDEEYWDPHRNQDL